MAVGAALLVTGCGGARTLEARDATVLVAERAGGDMDALLEGRLEVVGGCLGIEGPGEIGSVVVVWPHGTEVEVEDPPTIEVPDIGSVQVGDAVAVSGGFITDTVGGASARPVGGVEIPEVCLDHEVFLAR